MEPREMSHLSIEEKKAQFRQATITHRLLVYGPTGVGKSKMIETIAGQIKAMAPILSPPPFSAPLPPRPTPVLVIEADPPDRSVFNRGYYYRTTLTLMGERTYPQHMHMDIHGSAEPAKRRPLRGKAAESNDLPELREATKEAMRQHGVRVVILDEAHHMLYGGNGMAGSTLQEQLEWLKSLSSSTQVLHLLVGTYDLLNFGQLNGQISRRCLPVHFQRYLLQRGEDCIEFQAALLALLRKVPLHCDVETLVGSYWVYFYEGCIGCIGVLKDWLMRAVSTALDEGQETLTLDCLQDHAPPTDICRQMAIDAYEGEQKLNHTESNREHLWRLLQGGELIAPVPPLPPRQTLPNLSPPPVESVMSREDGISPPPSPTSEDAAPSAPAVKKARSRKKAEVTAPDQEQGSVTGAEKDAEPAPGQVAPKRRRKKTETLVGEDPEPHVTVPSKDESEASLGLLDTGDAASPPKPKRSRRVGEPKPKRYAVGEPEEGHHG
jgi:energy-coupling factor transporter ATP-binding protein EcfA2